MLYYALPSTFSALWVLEPFQNHLSSTKVPLRVLGTYDKLAR